MYKTLISTLVLTFAMTGNALAEGFLSTDNQRIVDGSGNEVILKGMGLGGWMLQEGYMLQTAAFANAQYQIRQKIAELIGEENTEAFYAAWLNNYCTRADIDSLASWGFNSVRLPMHYNLYTLPIEDEPVPGENTWLERGFEITDSLLAWCKANSMYLILDLHAAPGGQGMDQGISDYDPTKPSLWESQENRDKTVALWKRLAARYANEEWIGGYDLINEVNWNLPGNTLLRELYVEITDSIRSVDTNHIIFIEGNWFANDFTGLTPPWDDKMVYSFHKYWSHNDQGSIQWMLNIRQAFNVPIWCGEAGENSNVWFRDAIKLFKENKIGWAWWPLKKVESISGPLSVEKSDAYQTLLNYWEGNGPQPSVDFATEALMGLAENYKIENCIYQKDVIDAMIRQPGSDAIQPFAKHKVPGLIFGANYDLGTNGYAYLDEVVATYHVSTGEFTAWNNGWAYRNDGVDLEPCQDSDTTNGYNVGWVSTDEWINYTIEVDSSAAYDLTMRVASNVATGRFHLELDNRPITPSISVNHTGGWQNWKSLQLPHIPLEDGLHVLKLYIEAGEFNLNYFEFKNPSAPDLLDPICIFARTSVDGARLIASFNKKIDPALPPIPGGFTITRNGSSISFDAYQVDSTGYQIEFILQEKLFFNDEVLLSYSGSDVLDIYGKPLLGFSDFLVKNTQPVRILIPGRVEAEDYSLNSGFQFETTTDVGGGLNLGFANNGDYIEYLLLIQQAGDYSIDYRTASAVNGGQIKLELISDNTIIPVHTVNLPGTGGWQTWQTVSQNAVLPAGEYTLRLTSLSGEYNLNWYQFNLLTGIEDDAGIPLSYTLEQNYPNPFNPSTTIRYSLKESGPVTLKIFNILGETVATLVDERQKTGHYSLTFDGNSLVSGVYFYRLSTRDISLTRKMILIK